MILQNVSFLLIRTLSTIISNSLALTYVYASYIVACTKTFPLLWFYLKVNGGFWFPKVRDTQNSDTRVHLCASTFARTKDLKSSMTWAACGHTIRYMCYKFCRLMNCPRDDTTQRVWLSDPSNAACAWYSSFSFLILCLQIRYTQKCFLKIIFKNVYRCWV